MKILSLITDEVYRYIYVRRVSKKLHFRRLGFSIY
ncbi:hypothetical protein H5A43_06070 [Pectobacterium brasiliense]|nr:hypothetical protein [Pectobacterium brasiliense]